MSPPPRGKSQTLRIAHLPATTPDLAGSARVSTDLAGSALTSRRCGLLGNRRVSQARVDRKRNMRHLTPEQLREEKGIGFSRASLYRMYTTSDFPKPVKLGVGTQARNTWREDEIDTCSKPALRRATRRPHDMRPNKAAAPPTGHRKGPLVETSGLEATTQPQRPTLVKIEPERRRDLAQRNFPWYPVPVPKPDGVRHQARILEDHRAARRRR